MFIASLRHCVIASTFLYILETYKNDVILGKSGGTYSETAIRPCLQNRQHSKNFWWCCNSQLSIERGCTSKAPANTRSWSIRRHWNRVCRSTMWTVSDHPFRKWQNKWNFLGCARTPKLKNRHVQFRFLLWVPEVHIPQCFRLFLAILSANPIAGLAIEQAKYDMSRVIYAKTEHLPWFGFFLSSSCLLHWS